MKLLFTYCIQKNSINSIQVLLQNWQEELNHIMNLEMIGLLDTGHGELILRNLKVRLKQRRMEKWLKSGIGRDFINSLPH